MDSLELLADDCSLSLAFVDIDNIQLCYVSLIHSGVIRELGCDHAEVIVKKFLSIVSLYALSSVSFSEARYIANLDGLHCLNVINIPEKHTSGYAGKTSEGIVIHLQDAVSVKWIKKICLTYKQCDVWKNQLDSVSK